MSYLVENPEDRSSHDEAQIVTIMESTGNAVKQTKWVFDDN